MHRNKKYNFTSATTTQLAVIDDLVKEVSALKAIRERDIACFAQLIASPVIYLYYHLDPAKLIALAAFPDEDDIKSPKSPAFAVLEQLIACGFVISPDLKRFFNRVLSFFLDKEVITKSVNPYINYKKDFYEAEFEIVTLKKEKYRIAKVIPYYNLMPKILMIVIFTIAFLLNKFSTIEENSGFLIFMNVFAAEVLFMNIFEESFTYFESKQRSANLKNFSNNLMKITDCLMNKSWKQLKKEYRNKETMCFRLDLDRHDSLSGAVIARMLEYYLQSQNIITYHSNTHQVFVPVDQKLTDRTAAEVAQIFSASLDRRYKIYQLKIQILKVLSLVSNPDNLLKILYNDKKNLPAASFKTEVDTILLSRLKDFLNQLTVMGNNIQEHSSVLTISGFHPLEEKQFSSILVLLKKPSFIPINLNEDNSISDRKIQQPTLTQSKSLKGKLVKKQRVAPARVYESEFISNKIIFWQKDVFDPHDPECLVKPLRPLKLTQGRHFVTFKLKLKHMPKGYPNSLYYRLFQAVLNGSVGSKGQGWVFVTSLLCNDLTTGENNVPTSAKFRCLGIFSDLRLYARSTKVSTPEGDKILHRVVGIEPHAH